jgi:2,3,4,5-tetrahydropyridine-2-carboxylate N-succinyltransferase
MVFGDINDTESKVAKLVADDTMYHLLDRDANLVKSIRFARREYGKFKRLFLEVANTLGYEGPVKEHVDRILVQINKDKILQATFPLINWNENFGSAAVFMNALREAGVEVDTTASEVVCPVSDTFLTSCIETFRPYIPEARGDAHKNVQLVSQLSTLPRELGLGADDFKVVFIF